MSSKLVVGLCGWGTVGGGVLHLLRESPAVIFKAVLVRDSTKARDGVSLPPSCTLTTDPKILIEDDDINCLVEVMGGTDIAWEVTKSAIQRNKHVVSANKALISKHLLEIECLLKDHPAVHFLYEAAVCGGIPIIHTLHRSFVVDPIQEVMGIMNGTTNYILTKMQKEGLPFAPVLEEAKEKGYAEADPSADVLGWDARSKLCILAKLAFGLTVDESKVYCDGITKLVPVDFDYARIIKHKIKLLGHAKLVSSSDGPVCVLYVSPVFVPEDNPIAKIDDVTNVVDLRSSNLGSAMFVGPGAGRFPTANSVVSDLLDLASRRTDHIPAFPSSFCVSRMESDFQSDFYIRIVCRDRVGIIQAVAEALARQNISIFSILQTPIEDHEKVPFAIITETCRLSQITCVLSYMRQHQQPGETFDFLVEDPIFMPYIA